MKIKLSFVAAGLASLIISLTSGAQNKNPDIKSPDLTRYVDPFIGTGFHGHVFMGANIPFGAVQLGPVNISKGWDWCSGYHYSDSTIIGFAHTHLSGTGIGDLGDILVMPATGKVLPVKGTVGNPSSGYYSLFSHQGEIAKPGYYKVLLQRYNIQAELTATERVGFHQYTYPTSDNAQIIFDLEEGISDRAAETFIRKINDTTISGYRFSRGWARDQRIYFTAILSRPIRQFSIFEDSVAASGSEFKGRKTKAVLSFSTTDKEKIKLKVGISPVSEENALLNIMSELPGWNFDETIAAASAVWNKELHKVIIKTNNESRMRTFYTALYHTMIAPSTFNDINKDYYGTDKQVHHAASFKNMTTFSLWDTYRAAQPLFTLLHPDRVSDVVNTMLAIYQQQGKLPVWHLMGNETNTMPGYSAVPVVADAYLKGFKGFDADLAYQALKTTAMRDDRGTNFVKKYGFIPADSMVESVAMGLEYSIDDWCLAQMARKLNKTADYHYFSERGMNYKNYYDPSVHFMRGRISSSKWREPFSPFVARHMKDDFTEGNAWQYTWLVPQDVEGLVKMLGGEKAFIKKLDSLFVVQGDMGKEASGDITGLIGQYAHGNEPSHHIAYLYAFAGQPWKTADKIRYILDSLYTDKPAGLSGNEDVGQMSAWYVFSALGFYPVNPANGLYVLGSPVVDEATIAADQGKIFHILVKNNSKINKFIQKITWNGKIYNRSYLLHTDLVKGGELIIEMGSKPSTTWGVKPEDRPYSKSD